MLGRLLHDHQRRARSLRRVGRRLVLANQKQPGRLSRNAAVTRRLDPRPLPAIASDADLRGIRVAGSLLRFVVVNQI